jgi:hypothetical protein
MGLRLIKAYYYLAPLWCVLEVLAWPGLRAGPMAGGSLPLVGLFYTVEGAVAAAFWTGFWAAEHVALAENLVYLASAAALLFRNPASLARSIPGVAVAVFIAAVSLYRLVYLRRHRPRS